MILRTFRLTEQEARAAGWWDLFSVLQEKPRRGLRVVVAPLDDQSRADAVRLFWGHLGDLVADVVLDDVDGAWGKTSSATGGKLPS